MILGKAVGLQRHDFTYISQDSQHLESTNENIAWLKWHGSKTNSTRTKALKTAVCASVSDILTYLTMHCSFDIALLDPGQLNRPGMIQ